MNKKTEKIIKDAEREGFPIFVLTAKDYLSVEAIAGYFKDCLHGGCGISHLNGIADRIREFKEWQTDNADRVKFPD